MNRKKTIVIVGTENALVMEENFKTNQMTENQKVQFNGIEGMLYTPCETTVFKIQEFPCDEPSEQKHEDEMCFIEHPEGHYYPEHDKTLLFVNINDHLTIL